MAPLIIKVCGMTEAENIRNVEQLDVDMIGFIFYPKSPRCLCDEAMPSGKKKKRHKMSTHKRKKRLRKNRHKSKK